MKYTIVIEQTPRNYAAYVPDLPGCVATGASEAEVIREISAAIRLHIESLREHHEPVPVPRCTATVVDQWSPSPGDRPSFRAADPHGRRKTKSMLPRGGWRISGVTPR